MLTSEYSHTIDSKGRINFPAKLREDLGVSFMVSRGLNYCLEVYSMEEWTNLANSIKELPRSKRRELEWFYFAGAIEVTPDKQGRIVITQNLREYASLDKDVMVVGLSDHAEIWDKQTWEAKFAQITPDFIEQKMDELGF